MPSIPDEKDKFAGSSPSHAEPVAQPQAAGEFTKAFMIGNKFPAEQAEAEDQSQVSADNFKAKHDESPTEFTRLFNQFKGKQMFKTQGQDDGIPASAAPVGARVEDESATGGGGAEQQKADPGAFTRAFSKLELLREIPDSGIHREKTEPIFPSGPEPSGKEAPRLPEASDFTAAFQRALGSETFTPRPVDNPAREPDVFAKTEMPGLPPQVLAQPPAALEWASKTETPFTPVEEHPGSLTMLMKGIKQADSQHGFPVHEESNSAHKAAATDIFHVREEAAAAPLMNEGPSKFTAFMKLSELRTAEERSPAPVAMPAAVPSAPSPNPGWPPPPQFPPIPAAQQQAPVMQSPYFAPPPAPQVTPPVAPQLAVPAPASKLVTYLPLILILNGLVLLAILLVVLFAIKK